MALMDTLSTEVIVYHRLQNNVGGDAGMPSLSALRPKLHSKKVDVYGLAGYKSILKCVLPFYARREDWAATLKPVVH